MKKKKTRKNHEAIGDALDFVFPNGDELPPPDVVSGFKADYPTRKRGVRN